MTAERSIFLKGGIQHDSTYSTWQLKGALFFLGMSLLRKKIPEWPILCHTVYTLLEKGTYNQKNGFCVERKSARPNLGARIFRTENGVLPVIGIKKWLFLAQNSRGVAIYIYDIFLLFRAEVQNQFCIRPMAVANPSPNVRPPSRRVDHDECSTEGQSLTSMKIIFASEASSPLSRIAIQTTCWKIGFGPSARKKKKNE